MGKGGTTDARPGSLGPFRGEGGGKAGRQRACQRFRTNESGALLVFFAMCCAAIFLIAALSFDLGKRSSTQTELQSFADHVALAAAGELNGMPGAMARAQRAADRLIREEVTFAEGDGILAGADDFTLAFYDRLPTDETIWVSPLDAALPENDRIARFVRIEAAPVQVQWSFARLLSIFSTAALPSENVAAGAAAGHTALACDVTPIFFCMPDATAADPDGIWDPANHIGDAIQLATTSGALSNWTAGSMGFINVDSRVDRASYCWGQRGATLYNCLMTVARNRSQCIENGTLELQDANVPDIIHRYFNARMDKYMPEYRFLRRNVNFPVPPIVTKGFEEGSTCGGSAGVPTNDAMGFPADDCMTAGTCGATGDGDWSEGRIDYVEANYSVDADSLGSVEAAERITVLGAEYHIDDPFRPGDATNPRAVENADHPVVMAGSTRWRYYNAEVSAAHFDDPIAAFGAGEVDYTGLSSDFRATALDLPDMTMADGTVVPRLGTRLPHCAPDDPANRSYDPRRRAFVAAAVDCGTEPINGDPNARATWFVEVFLLDVAEPVDAATEVGLEFNVEIISPGLQNTGISHTNGTFRNLVQLFR